MQHTFQDGDSVSTFYTKLKTVWREIDAYGETPHCECDKCTCNINGRINDRENRVKIRKFLMGLSDEYMQIHPNILSMEFLPKLNKVFQMISHEETQQGLASNSQSNVAHAFFSKVLLQNNCHQLPMLGKTHHSNFIKEVLPKIPKKTTSSTLRINLLYKW